MNIPRTSSPRHAFSLMELLVVMTVMLTMMGLALAGTTAWERRNTTISTFTVLRGVIDSSHRNAMQFGSSGLVYGFSIDYRRSPNPSTEWAWQWWNTARSVKPWVITPDGAVHYQADFDLFADTGLGGGGLLKMTGNELRFLDTHRPCGSVLIDGEAQPFNKATTTADILHVAFEPRTGFVHATWTAAASLAAADFAPSFSSAMLTSNTNAANRVDISIGHLRFLSPNYVARPAAVIAIGPTGMSECRTKARAP